MNEDWRCPSREAPEPSRHVLPAGETACSKCGQEPTYGVYTPETFRGVFERMYEPEPSPIDHTSCSRRRFGSGCVPWNEESDEA